MISKERLNELIEQKAKIYSTHWQEEIDLSLPCKIVDMVVDGVLRDYLRVDEGMGFNPNYLLSGLTEDIEGAKWEEEFGCITRTERLELPTWEEFDQSEKLIRFIGKFGQKCKIDGYFNLDLQSGFIDVTENGSSQINLPEYNKENYTLACRKAKELFLGGSDGNIR